MKFTTRSAVAVTVGTIALAGVAVLGVGLAGAQTSDSSQPATSDPAPTRPPRPQLTDEQKQCLADNGVTLPQRSADGTRTPPTDEQRAAFRAAAEACGLPVPTGHGFGGPGGPGMRPQLTDEQKQCLADNGVTLPQRSADGTRTPPTDEQRAAFRAAAEACGLPVPTGHGLGGASGTAQTTGSVVAA